MRSFTALCLLVSFCSKQVNFDIFLLWRCVLVLVCRRMMVSDLVSTFEGLSSLFCWVVVYCRLAAFWWFYSLRIPGLGHCWFFCLIGDIFSSRKLTLVLIFFHFPRWHQWTVFASHKYQVLRSSTTENGVTILDWSLRCLIWVKFTSEYQL